MFSFVKQILTDPTAAWGRTAPDRASPAPPPLKYLLVMAALPAVGAGLGALTSWTTRDPLYVIARIATSYLVSLGLVLGFARLVRLLANAFESRRDAPPAVQLAIFSTTPWLLYGALTGLPWIGSLVQFAAVCHCGYLFAVGAPLVLGTPQARSVGFAAVAYLAFVIGAGSVQSMASWVLLARLLPAVPLAGAG